MQNFLQSFGKRLAKDLENGRYGSADDFARGITKHYMASIKLNAPNPAGIAPTLPAPAFQGAPAPVGPTLAYIPPQPRQKLFYNVVKAYYVGKELSQGKADVKELARDVKLVVESIRRTKREIQDLDNKVKNVQKEIKQLKEDLQNVIPEVKKFIQSKIDLLKELFAEVRLTVDRIKQARAQFGSTGVTFNTTGSSVSYTDTSGQVRTISRENYENTLNFDTLIQEELDDLNFIKNLKIKPSFKLGEVQESLTSVINLINKSSTIVRKYQNRFSTEANLRVYIRKKVATALRELFDVVNGLLAPEKFIRIWKDLLRVPRFQRIGKIILRIIDKNVILKAKKKQLIAWINLKKKVVMDQLKKKLDTFKEKLKEKGQYVATRLIGKSNDTKFKEQLRASKTVKDTVKKVKRTIKLITNWIKYIDRVMRSIIQLMEKVFGIQQGINKVINESKQLAERVKNKFKQIENSIQQAKEPSARQAREDLLNVNLAELEQNFVNGVPPAQNLVKKIGAGAPFVNQLLTLITDALRLTTTKQLAPILRTPLRSATTIVQLLDDILTKEIPSIGVLLTTNPNASDYKSRLVLAQQIKQGKGSGAVAAATVFSSGKGRKITYLVIMKFVRKALIKLKELERKALGKLALQYNKMTDVTKDKDALEAYIDTIIDKKPKVKKIKNKKRRIDQKRIDIKTKVAKIKSITKQIQIGYRIIDGSAKLANGLKNERKKPISKNQDQFRRVFTAVCDLKIERKKMTPAEKQQALKKLNKKLADFRAYEFIYVFFLEVIKESRLKKMGEEIRNTINEKKQLYAEQITIVSDESENALEKLIGMIQGDTPVTVTNILKFPINALYRANTMTAIVKAEKKYFARLRRKAGALSAFIPPDTTDPVLKKIKYGLNKASSLLVWLIDWLMKAFRAILQFVFNLVKDVALWIKDQVNDIKEKVQEDVQDKLRKEANRKLNLEGRIASIMFGTAARLLWTGANWTNIPGTRFVTINIGKFTPTMVMSNAGGAQSFAENLANGFNNQLKLMTGLVIPLPSYGIPPFPFSGYLQAKTLPPDLPPPGPPVDTVITPRVTPDINDIQYA
jgi:hypothetical protein